MNFTLNSLRQMFPRDPKNSAAAGLIPIAFFTENEPAIRAVMREHKLRSLYRGPRRSKSSATTLRRDAYGVLLYRK